MWIFNETFPFVRKVGHSNSIDDAMIRRPADMYQMNTLNSIADIINKTRHDVYCPNGPDSSIENEIGSEHNISLSYNCFFNATLNFEGCFLLYGGLSKTSIGFDLFGHILGLKIKNLIIFIESRQIFNGQKKSILQIKFSGDAVEGVTQNLEFQ